MRSTSPRRRRRPGLRSTPRRSPPVQAPEAADAVLHVDDVVPGGQLGEALQRRGSPEPPSPPQLAAPPEDLVVGQNIDRGNRVCYAKTAGKRTDDEVAPPGRRSPPIRDEVVEPPRLAIVVAQDECLGALGGRVRQEGAGGDACSVRPAAAVGPGRRYRPRVLPRRRAGGTGPPVPPARRAPGREWRDRSPGCRSAALPGSASRPAARWARAPSTHGSVPVRTRTVSPGRRSRIEQLDRRAVSTLSPRRTGRMSMRSTVSVERWSRMSKSRMDSTSSPQNSTRAGPAAPKEKRSMRPPRTA